MSLPFTLPDWLPWWVPIAVLVPVLLYALVFLFMPFSVIGVRGRLDSIEARLDEIQHDIRSLALRLPEPMHAADYDDPPSLMGRPQPEDFHAASLRPPIPPAPHYPQAVTPPNWPADGQGGAARRGSRAEPRLDWPR